MSLETRSFQFGEFLFDGKRKILLRNKKPIKITPKALDFLKVLLENSGEIVEKQSILETVWPNTFVEEGNLSFTVNLIRKALNDTRKEPRFIETVPKRGYRFIGDVNQLHQLEALPEHIGSGDENLAGRHRPILMALSVIASIAVFAAGFAWLTGDSRSLTGPAGLIPQTNDGKITNAVITPDGKQIVFSRKEESGEALWRRDIGTKTQAQLVPAQAVEYIGLSVGPKSDFVYYSVFSANEAIPTLVRIPLDGGLPESLPNVTTDVSVTFSPDGQKIAFTDSLTSIDETYLKTANSDGTDNRVLLTVKGSATEFPVYRANPAAWSLDGRSIAVAVRETDESGSFSTILLVDPENGARSSLSNNRWDQVEHIAWLDGDHLALIDSRPDSPFKNIWQVSRITGDRVHLTPEPGNFEWLSSSGGKLFTVQRNVHSGLYVAEYDEPRNELSSKQIYAEGNSIEAVAWSMTGQILFNSLASGKNEVWRIERSGTLPQQVTFDSDLSQSFAVSTVDDSLVLSVNRDRRRVLVAADPAGQYLRELTDGTDDDCPTISQDGREVVFQRGVAKTTLWGVRIDGGQPTRQVTGYHARNPEYSTDGRMISFHFMDFSEAKPKWKLGVMDSKTRRLVNHLDFPVPIIQRKTAWHPKSGLLTMVFNNGEDVGMLLMDPLTAEHHSIEKLGAGTITSFAWSPDGASLVFAQKHETSNVVALVDF